MQISVSALIFCTHSGHAAQLLMPRRACPARFLRRSLLALFSLLVFRRAGADCLGTYQPELGLLMVHLVGPGITTATIVYRALDDDSEYEYVWGVYVCVQNCDPIGCVCVRVCVRVMIA